MDKPTIQDYLRQLKTQRLEFKPADTITVPATATKKAFTIVEVKITGMVKMKVEAGLTSDGSWVPASTLSTQANQLLLTKLKSMVKSAKANSAH